MAFSELVMSLLSLMENAFHSTLQIIDITVESNIDMMPIVIGMIILAVFLNIGFWRTLLVLAVCYYVYLKYYSLYF